MNAPSPTIAEIRRRDPLAGRAFAELHHASIRLRIAEGELMWAMSALAAGHMNAHGALAVLDAAMDELAGAKP